MSGYAVIPMKDYLRDQKTIEELRSEYKRKCREVDEKEAAIKWLEEQIHLLKVESEG